MSNARHAAALTEILLMPLHLGDRRHLNLKPSLLSQSKLRNRTTGRKGQYVNCHLAISDPNSVS